LHAARGEARFIAGLLLKATEAAAPRIIAACRRMSAEVIAGATCYWGLSDAMVRDPEAVDRDFVLPKHGLPGNAYQIIATMAYTRVKYLTSRDRRLVSHLSQQPRADSRIGNPALSDQYLRGFRTATRPRNASSCSSCCGTVASEFGGRHELYEINYRRVDRRDPALLPVRAHKPPAMPIIQGFAEE